MLNWARQFNIFCFLDNQQYGNAPHRYECLLAAGAHNELNGGYGDFKNIDGYVADNDWAFGHLCFELLHPLYKIDSPKRDATGFPLFSFFKPQHLLYIQNGMLYIESENGQAVYEALMAWAFEKVTPSLPIQWQQRFTKKEYLNRVRRLQQHILRGDCYEINFCQEFFAHDADVNPIEVFQTLMRLSPAPFSALYKWNDAYLICASPERFLAKTGDRLIAQPVKGTARRSADETEDAALKTTLQQSAKEQSENVMIVDLMRNDLSKVCTRGSVRVDELAGVYSFPQVHQLISTISGRVKREVSFSQIMAALFPMGSMTGAPKQRVLQLIEQYEPTARGIFSGSVGYVSPDGDFDFNVVIRSIMYNRQSRYLSYQVGSGITFYADAEQEWEECLLKAWALEKVLGPLSPGGGT